MSHHFPKTWLSKSSYLNLCDFWLWDYLKNVVFNGLFAILAELKSQISQHLCDFWLYDYLKNVVFNGLFAILAELKSQITQHLCDFWLWDYLKNVVFNGLCAILAELKSQISQHFHNMTHETFKWVVNTQFIGFKLWRKMVDSIFNISCESLVTIYRSFCSPFLRGFRPKDC